MTVDNSPIVFTLHGSRVIHIDTPCGLITIGRNQEDKRRIDIGLPAGLNCSLDRTGCLDRSKYLKEEEGKVVARYKLLVHVFEQGE